MLCSLWTQPEGLNTKVEITVEVPDGIVHSHAGQLLKRYLDESFAQAEKAIDEYVATLEPPAKSAPRPLPKGGLGIAPSVLTEA
jgi:hypothetical protein